MSRLLTRLVCAAIALSLVSAPALAAPKKPAKSPEERFSKLDKNSDSKLSLDEFVGKKTDKAKERATKRFKTLDKNTDESLSLDEFKAGAKAPKA